MPGLRELLLVQPKQPLSSAKIPFKRRETLSVHILCALSELMSVRDLNRFPDANWK